MRNSLFLLFSVCFFLLSCENEEATLPAYIQELAEISTNHEGFAETLTFDQGETLHVVNKVGGLKPDTLHRVRVLYQRTGTSVWLSGLVPVLTPHLNQYKSETVITDPVSLTACWRGLHYLNLRLDVSGTAEGKHLFGFHKTGLTLNPDSTKTLQAILLHNKNNDPSYYTRETFLSLPLRPLEKILRAGFDSLQLGVCTEQGWVVRKFLF